MPAKTRTATPDTNSLLTKVTDRLDALDLDLAAMTERLDTLAQRVEKLERHVL